MVPLISLKYLLENILQISAFLRKKKALIFIAIATFIMIIKGKPPLVPLAKYCEPAQYEQSHCLLQKIKTSHMQKMLPRKRGQNWLRMKYVLCFLVQLEVPVNKSFKGNFFFVNIKRIFFPHFDTYSFRVYSWWS